MRQGRQPWYRWNASRGVAALRSRQALYRSLGLRWPGGRPRSAQATLSAVEKGKLMVTKAKADLSAALPAVAADDRALTELTPGEALRIAWKGLERLDELLSDANPGR